MGVLLPLIYACTPSPGFAQTPTSVKSARPSGLREHWPPASCNLPKLPEPCVYRGSPPLCQSLAHEAGPAQDRGQAAPHKTASSLQPKEKRGQVISMDAGKCQAESSLGQRPCPSLFLLTLAPMCIILSNLSCGQNGLRQC